MKRTQITARQYHNFVRSTDQYTHETEDRRFEIAVYGLVGEIGSVVTAVKKQLLAEDGKEKWNYANPEIIEELGDVLWYCFSLVQIANNGQGVNIPAQNISLLSREIEAGDERAEKIRRALAALDATKRDKFLRAARFFAKTKDTQLDQYQKIAFLTARTNKKTLLEVCLSVLWQLGAELMRFQLPPIELVLNRTIRERSINTIVGEILWHIAAIASVYGLRLGTIVQANKEKVVFRRPQVRPTRLHDSNAPSGQRFPRKFEVTFVTTHPGRSRMYFNGKQLGDDLTDNAYHDDGYRFHDVMHLANVAVLGWSPVVRGLMRRKRKYKARLDEVEDGARAAIVEEAVVKIIHSEGEEAVKADKKVSSGPVRMFADPDDVPFSLIKLVHRLVVGLEVRQNKYWEWERAVLEGYKVFHELCWKGRGTVVVDLDKRSLKYRKGVSRVVSTILAMEQPTTNTRARSVQKKHR